MPLWTEIITPYEATLVARAEIELREQQNGTLAKYLPNVSVPDNHVKFYVGDHGMVDEAYFRALNAAPELIGGESLESKLIELPSLSNNQYIDERTQHALRSLPEDQVRKSITAAVRRAGWSMSDKMERTRGLAFLNAAAQDGGQRNFNLNDVFGRDAALSYTLAKLWRDPSADGMMDIQNGMDLYASKNSGALPGGIVASPEAYAAFSRLAQFRTVLVGGATQLPQAGMVDSTVQAAGFPSFDIYRRQTKNGRILPKEYIFFVPQATAINDPDGSALGATFWGQTVTATSPEFDLIDSDMPGAVVGVYREDRIPYKVEVMADAIALPVLRDANKVMAVKVL